jgi:hypothetical protein
LKEVVPERKALCIGGKIDAWQREKIEIEITIGPCAGTTDIEIPAPQRSVDALLIGVEHIG